jgi:hypothetical protein
MLVMMMMVIVISMVRMIKALVVGLGRALDLATHDHVQLDRRDRGAIDAFEFEFDVGQSQSCNQRAQFGQLETEIEHQAQQHVAGDTADRIEMQLTLHTASRSTT